MSHRLAELETEFKKNGGKFQEFKIGTLFDVENTWVYGKNRDYQNRSDTLSQGYIPIISGITVNNGVNYYTNDKLPNDEIFSNCLTISTRGEYSGTVTYHEGAFGLANNILTMPLPNWSKRGALYFGTLVRKLGYGGYSGYPRKDTLKEDVISLPVNGGQIAFQYMEDYMSILEEERVDVLESYLKTVGLDSFILTPEEEDAYNRFRNGSVKFKEFKIGDLFDIHPTKSYKMTNRDLFKEIGKTPVVTNTSTNNGVSGYVNLEPTENGGIITYSDTTTSEGIFYQPLPFVGYSHVQGLYPKSLIKEWNEQSLLYFVSLFRNGAGGRFDYANKFNRKIASEIRVLLPFVGDIDFKFIEFYIKALEKKVIQHVIEWKDKVITKTKEVIDV